VWEGYLHFLQMAFEKLPATQTTGYFPVNEKSFHHVKNSYEIGSCFFWKGYSVISTNLENTAEMVGTNGVVLRIRVISGKSLKYYSAQQSEEEILLSPYMKFFVTKGLYTKNRISYVQMVQQKEGGTVVYI